MTKYERNLREILESTKHFLRKKDERFQFKVIFQPKSCRYIVRVLLGRREFEENYTFRYCRLADDFFAQHYHDRFGTHILTNLKLHEVYYK